MGYERFYFKNVSIYIVLLVIILSVLYHYYCVRKCRIFTYADIKTRIRKELKTADDIAYYISSKNTLGLIVMMQWGIYSATFLLYNSKNGIFGLVIPIMYTYIFENIYTIKANQKMIPSYIQKSDLDSIKMNNIILLLLIIVRATVLASIPLMTSSDNIYQQYLNYCFVAMVSYAIGYIFMRLILNDLF